MVRQAAQSRRLVDLILPAAARLCEEETGVKVNFFRGDREVGGEHLFIKIQRTILNADLILVLLDAANPNVNIELGWAQGFWRDPIILCQKGRKRPVDIEGLEVIMFAGSIYEQDEEALLKNDTVRQIARRLVQLVCADKCIPQKALPRSTTADGIARMYDRFSDAVKYDRWSEELYKAEEFIWIASTSLYKFIAEKYNPRKFFDPQQPDEPLTLLEVLLDRALSGVDVTILLLDEENPSLGEINGLDPAGRRRDRTQINIKQAELQDAFEELFTLQQTVNIRAKSTPGIGTFEVIAIREQYPSFRATVTENLAWVTLRLYSEFVDSGLSLELPAVSREGRDNYSRSGYDQILGELKHFRERNRESSRVKFDAFLREAGGQG